MTARTPRVRPFGIAGMAAGTLLVALATANVIGLRINDTVSMPRGLWRVEATKAPLRRGTVVTFCPPDTAPFRGAVARGYIQTGSCPGGYEPLIKPVAAVAGDVVVVSASGVSVNERPVPGTAQLAHDGAGRPVQPVHPGVYVVANGEVWLLSGHDPRSFDSRYFGPVPAANVQGLARPLWVLR